MDLIGEGGFARIYFDKDNNMVYKMLKGEFFDIPGIKSRFKREYEITKSLENDYGIIKVYEFNQDKMFYTMQKADTTLEKYILNNELNQEIQIKIILEILKIFKGVHNKRNHT